MKTLRETADEMLARLPDSYSALPDFDLYMDQILDCLSRWQATLRGEEKLTSSMINNYTKDGLVPRAKGKKYGREHLVRLSAIVRLKQVLSVKDMAVLMDAELAAQPPEVFFESFNALIREAVDKVASREDDDVAELALRLAVNAYANKIACEYLIGQLAAPPAGAKERKEQKEHGKSNPA